MDIHRNNYEAFLLDLLEGRLSAEEERELKAFLNDHPEFVMNLPDVELLSLEKNTVFYPDQKLLKKEIPVAGTPLTEANFDMFSIARMEGDLSSSQEQEHIAAVAGEENKRKEWQQWQQTRLEPEILIFSAKKALKKRTPPPVRRMWLAGLAAAATLTLILFLLRMESTAPGLADSESPDITPMEEQDAVSQEMPAEYQEASTPAKEEIPGENVLGEPGAEQVVNSSVLASEHKINESLPASGNLQQSIPEPTTRTVAEEIQVRPLRMAVHFSESPAGMNQPDPDRIKALPSTTIAARKSGIPVNEIAELDRQLIFKEITREHNISFLTVANAGIKGINKLTGSDISLMASRDEQGEVSGYRLKAKHFSLSGPLARED